MAKAELSPELAQRLAQRGPNETIPIILTLAEQVDLARHTRGRLGARELILDLQDTARRSQAPVTELLDRRGFAGPVKSFWIQNCMFLAATGGLIDALASLPEVGRIEFDVAGGAPELVGEQVESGERATYWNMDLIRAPEIWSVLGLDGTGIVVGSMDSGIDTNHPALAGKWRGGTNSWRDIINNLPNPYDDHGHGTHTIGTMVGGDGPGPFSDDIGLAYNAKVISAKVLDANNSFSSASIVIAGAQWILDPDLDPKTDDFPHVVNNSWYFGNQNYIGFYASVAAWRAAGIIPVGIVANFGPAPSSTRPPGSYDNIMGVAATTSADVVASFSSRGPSPIGFGFPADQRKPDFAAPGQQVRSSWTGGGYLDGSGTSMAAPHVAATAAIMLQLFPDLTFDGVRAAIMVTAVDIAAAGYDFDAGYGRLDAFLAVELIDDTLAVPASPIAARQPLRLLPNPFQNHVEIALERPFNGVRVEILDVQGRHIRRLGPSTPSTTGITWDGRDEQGRAMPAGAYFIRVAGEGLETRTGRLMMVR